VDAHTLTDLISIPLFTAAVGYVTNWTGVLMLFRPIRFHGVRVPGLRLLFPLLPRRVQVLPLLRYDGRLGWQGIVPSRADKMASLAVDKGLAKLGSIGDFYRELEPERVAGHLAMLVRPEVRAVVESIGHEDYPWLWDELPTAVREAVHRRVQRELPGLVIGIGARIGQDIDQLVDAKLMLIRYFGSHRELLNELFLAMGHKELRFMKNFGAYFGAPLGLVLFGILQVLPYWWVLPLGGVGIGWLVNYVGIAMIFQPVGYRRWVPWHRGLLLRRQDEVTALYARLIADHVITVQNIADELFTGPRSDRTMRLVEDALRPAVDRAIGPVRAAVRAAIGTDSYDQLRSAAAERASTLVPAALADAAFNRRQSERIYHFIASQMSGMRPADFVEMLRSAIRQDEWLLLAHGGALGLLAGLLHLGIFGV
jgi:hypothetical protein